jgi:2-dehydropantoate 2-reductase
VRIAVVGAGNAGSRYGAGLVGAGEDVTFIARGARLEELRTIGFTVTTPAGSTVHRVKATNRPDEVGPVDLVLFCVKTYDLDEAAHQVTPLIGPDTTVIPVQNGLGIADRLAAILGEHAVTGGVECISPEGLTFGELDGTMTPRVERIAGLLKSAAVRSHATTSIGNYARKKFIAICATEGVYSVVRLPKGPVFAHQETRELFVGVMKEAKALAHASGANIPHGMAELLMVLFEPYPPGTASSQLKDILAGRRLELEELNGAVRLGKKLGIPTPLNCAVYAALKPYLNGSPRKDQAHRSPAGANQGITPEKGQRRAEMSVGLTIRFRPAA